MSSLFVGEHPTHMTVVVVQGSTADLVVPADTGVLAAPVLEFTANRAGEPSVTHALAMESGEWVVHLSSVQVAALAGLHFARVKDSGRVVAAGQVQHNPGWYGRSESRVVTTRIIWGGGGGGGGASTWDAITDKPATFPPTAHSHAVADVTGLQGALDGKQAAGSYAAASHTHNAADLSGVVKTVNGTSPDSSGNVSVSGGGGSRTLIATLEAVSGAATFNSIPSGFTKIVVEWTAHNGVGGGKNRALTINGDTGENYATSGNNGGESSIPVLAPQSGTQAAYIEIYRYDSTDAAKTVLGQSVGNTNAGNDNLAINVLGGAWLSAAAITSLTFTPSHGADVCTYHLYGVTP